jgi:transcriptional regulator with XRE-family HTH domain
MDSWVTHVSTTEHNVATSSKAVRDAIAAAGVTADQLAHRTGIACTAIDRKLAARAPFTLPELTRIARYLDVPASSLLAPGRVA